MQQLTLSQLTAISGGTDTSLSNLFSATTGAFQNGLTSAELGVGVVGMGVGAGLATLGASNTYKAAGLAIVGAYVLNSHFKPDFSGVKNWVNSFFASTTPETTV